MANWSDENKKKKFFNTVEWEDPNRGPILTTEYEEEHNPSQQQH